jgi:hypothetical protein
MCVLEVLLGTEASIKGRHNHCEAFFQTTVLTLINRLKEILKTHYKCPSNAITFLRMFHTFAESALVISNSPGESPVGLRCGPARPEKHAHSIWPPAFWQVLLLLIATCITRPALILLKL